MDNLISILIVDDNIEFCNVLNEYLNQREDMTVKGIAKDGIEAIEMIKEREPEIVILDLIMPNLDGIGVLERIPEMKLKSRPIFIILTAIGQDIVIQKAMEFGADYYIMKPFDVNMLVSRIRQLVREKADTQGKNMAISWNEPAGIPEVGRESLEQVISNLLKNMGIPPNIAGYRYLREAVMLSIDNTAIRNSVTRDVYSNIAKKHNTTTKNIKRAIRCVVESAYRKVQNTENDNNMFIEFHSKSKPTNQQVITYLITKARLQWNLFE